MNIFILQKSITDLKEPVVRKPYESEAKTLGEFICEMVNHNASKKTPQADKIKIFDALENSDRISYGRDKRKFNSEKMREFALSAFEDKLYIVKNTTQDIQYEALTQELNFREGDEIALIRLKYLRGVIW